MKDVQEEFKELMRIFPKSFINQNLELILIPKTNIYFLTEDCKSKRDVCAKLLMWASRTISKGNPYRNPTSNKRYRANNLMYLNNYLQTHFSSDDMIVIYQKLGNGIRPELTYQFIDSDFNMEVLLNG